MKRFALFFAVFLAAVAAPAQTVPELFQKAKAQVKGEAWKDALATLRRGRGRGRQAGQRGLPQAARGAARVLPRASARPTSTGRGGAAPTSQMFLRGDAQRHDGPRRCTRRRPSRPSRPARKPPRSRLPRRPGPAGRPRSSTPTRSSSRRPTSASRRARPGATARCVWLMTPDEKKTWSQLSSDGERAEFVEKFWAARNPNGEGGENTFKTGFERRVAFADAKFVQDERKRGSMTDRGMVFVLLGPPTYGGRKPIRTGDDSSEAAGMSSTPSAGADARWPGPGAVGAGLGTDQAVVGPGRLDQRPVHGPGHQAAGSRQTTTRKSGTTVRNCCRRAFATMQVDVTFITRKGYGVNVLKRDSMTLTTLDAAKRKAGCSVESALAVFAGGVCSGGRRRRSRQNRSRSSSGS